MRYTNLLPLVATLATAIVIPDDATAQQMSLDVDKQAEETTTTTTTGWWDGLREAARQQATGIKESVDATIQEQWDALSSTTPEETIDFLATRARAYLDGILHINHPEPLFLDGGGGGGNGHVGRPDHHGTTNLTVYQSIQISNFTKKFAALINDFPDIVALLNSTEANVTAFVPIDKAFERIPEHHGKPPKEFVQKLLEYHIVPGYYPLGRVVASHTLPTALTSEALGGRPQRLRISFNVFGLRVNFFNKVNIANFFTSNGVVHGLDSILVPPPSVRRSISLFPTQFSTLELAAEKTGLLPHHDKEHHHPGKGDDEEKQQHHHQLTGLTVFAPTNRAFSRLGPAANAFLFNTEKGLAYLRALLKYHIVVNQTLYSDAYYGLKGARSDEDLFPTTTPHTLGSDAESNEGGGSNGHFHVDLPTLLDDKRLSIDIARWYGFINIRINGYQNVAVEDGVARDGVVQVVSSVLIPPRDPKGGSGGAAAWSDEADGDISVDELVERLGPYIGEDDMVDDREEEKKKQQQQQQGTWGEL